MKTPSPSAQRRKAPLLSAAFGCALTLSAGALAQAQPDAPSTIATRPSNAQLASPAIERKVDALLKKMTLREKIGQLMQYNDAGCSAPTTADGDNPAMAANPTAQCVDAMKLAADGGMGSMLNVVGAARTDKFQRAAVEKSRLHIPLLFGADVIHGYRTIYPVPLGLAASWNPKLVTDLSRMAASEATTGGVRWFYSPMVDISRDARWGRSVEGAGEDPYLGAAMARAYIHGYQGDDLSKPDHVAASVKHFAAYGAAEAGREYNTTDMSDIRLRQVYLPPYKAAIEAGSATVMSAFNALNGVPATANPYLLTDILRKEWGFDGFVVSDYTSIMELTHHGIALTPAEATKKAIDAGTDVDMMSHYYDTQLPKLLKEHKVSMATIDEAVRRVLRVKFALGLFKHPYARGTEVTHAVPAHRPLVRKAAEESFVLLKNDKVGAKPVLPLSSDVRTIALIGPLADDANQMTGAWGGAYRKSDVITVRQALAARMKKNGGTLLYAKGTDIKGDSTAGFAAARQAAEKADVVVMALGESGDMSGEAGSRAHLDLPGKQQQLLESMVATGKPVVLLVFSGRPLVLDWAARHVPAIMETWFPGVEAGHAIANVLFGDVSPSGKLPMSFPRAVGQEPLYYNQFPTGRPPGKADLSKPPQGDTRFISRYIDVPNSALFPFGWGLTYSHFAYSGVHVSRSKLPLAQANRPGAKNLVTATATVKNTGSRTATDVAQLYVRNLGASVEQPVRSLKGFRRVTLKPGESRTITFELGFPELSFWNIHSKQVVEATHYTVWVGDSSLANKEASFIVTP
ncbi:glycoside hydrolase family 3 N-terminal domain-containing protein [Oleiagrimonas sp. MCCC 1A03011]|uniref:glycoside hydrolase family 3 N-terminal domain-containing protein n=1 Tax=Oleiagrimonas sp. MCCC 1A03011 TaxID=1926883 RepID=UPI000DD6FF8E|nr:glycoside hydrolase family 3 N-terminal domain-containing protein [Oleiagrimonas sp. MCCC 1A03011]